MSTSKVLVLYYHRINSLERDINMLAVSPYQFQQHMKFIKKNYITARFEEDWTLLDGPGVVITFDDGYLDNYQNALPILEELEIPATIFISTGTMEQERELWWDELEYLLMEGIDIPGKFHLQDEIFEYTWRTDTFEMKLNCYRSLHFLMKNCISIQKRDRWFKQLWDWRRMKPTVRKTHLTLNNATCIELAKSNLITIGGHTVSHPSLAKLDTKDQKKEIEYSLDYLSRLLSKNVDVFSYPFGVKGVDYDQNTIDICKEFGIKKAATTEMGIWTKKKGDYRIPRNCVQNIDIFCFKKRIEELWEGYE